VFESFCLTAERVDDVGKFDGIDVDLVLSDQVEEHGEGPLKDRCRDRERHGATLVDASGQTGPRN
jgi:hypothetical protein